MRPEEALALNLRDVDLPAQGWGEIVAGRAEPHAGREWTDSGANRDTRGVEHRAPGETRRVPCPPPLTALLRECIGAGVGTDGRLFHGERSTDELPKITIRRAWQRARAAVFTKEVHAGQLARMLYDLRHAAVSTWLNGGVPPTTVAEWAGHSVEVLLSTYAKCIDGTDAAIQRCVKQAIT
jgi:integrase